MSFFTEEITKKHIRKFKEGLKYKSYIYDEIHCELGKPQTFECIESKDSIVKFKNLLNDKIYECYVINTCCYTRPYQHSVNIKGFYTIYSIDSLYR